MQPDQIGGLPAHPLIVHLPVVLVPLAAIGALLMLVRPSWRHALVIPTAVFAGLGAIATQLAISSGEWLEHHVDESDLIEQHSHIAEQARPWIFLFALVMIGIAVWDVVQRRRGTDAPAEGGDGSDATTPEAGSLTAVRPRAATAVVAVTALGLLLGVVSTVQVYRTGHSGAKATWQDATTDTPKRSEHDDDGG